MASIFSKARNLFQSKNYGELAKKTADYIRYIAIKIWCAITLKEADSDLKKTNKNYVFYQYLKSKYRRFLENYAKAEQQTHEYSDIIWWCWLQGEKTAPEICKICLASLKKQMPEKRIIIITSENYREYAEFPDFIMKKYEKGLITHTHFSDLLRLQLLIAHGGTWIDATVFCTGYPEYAFGTPLFVFKTNERNDPATAAQSWFISAEKNNPILRLTRDLLFDYWKTHKTAIHYFIFYFFLKIAADFYEDEWRKIPWFPDLPPHILQRELNAPYSETRWKQICRMSDIHKLSYKIDLSKGGTFYEFLLKSTQTD